MRLVIGIFLGIVLSVNPSYAQKVVEVNKALDPVISNIQGSLPTLDKARRLYYESRNASAETMYLSLIESGTMERSDYLRFAHTLFQNAKVNLAKEIYNEYKRITGKGNQSFERMLAQVERAGLPIPPDNLTLFVSDQPTSNLNQNSALCLIDRQQFGYYKINGTMVELADQDKHKMDGILLHSYTLLSEELMVFSGMEESTYELYLARKKNGVWRKPKKLELGISGHQIYPSFNKEEGILHFSAKVTKEQGFDIYSSYFKSGEEQFTPASSAGPEVNTAKDEISPVFMNKKLYFASDGWPGFGGFDIYSYSYTKGLLDHESQINSLADELAFVQINQKRYVYLSAPEGASLEYILKPAQFPHAEKPEQTNPSPPQEIEEKKPVIQQTVEKATPVRNNPKPTQSEAKNTSSGISGQVINDAYQPLKGVHLLIYSESKQGVFGLTDQNGKFTISNTNQITFPAKVKLFVNGELTTEYKIRKPHNNTFMVEIPQPKPKETIPPRYEDTEHTDPPPAPVVQKKTTEKKVEKTATHTATPTEKKPIVSKPDASDVGKYYVVIASVTNSDLAYDYYTKWVKKFPNLEIKKYGPTRYRVLTYAGTNKTDAMELYKSSKKIKGDVWLLTP
jgi:hypothetical protein